MPPNVKTFPDACSPEGVNNQVSVCYAAVAERDWEDGESLDRVKTPVDLLKIAGEDKVKVSCVECHDAYGCARQ